MSLSRSVRRLVLGEHGCRVLIEVHDLGPDGWRRLTRDPALRWRRLGPPKPNGSTPALRRRRGKVDGSRTDPAAPTPALVEATGTSSGGAAVAARRVAVLAMSRIVEVGLRGELVAAGPADPSTERPAAEGMWPVEGDSDVVVFGSAEQPELARRFSLAASAWSLDLELVRPPTVPAPGRHRRAARANTVAGLAVLPLLLMIVPALGPWLTQRDFVLLLLAAVVTVGLPLLVVHYLERRHPFCTEVRRRLLVMAAALVMLLLVARVAAAVPVPPFAVVVGALLSLAIFVPVAMRLVPLGGPGRAAAWLGPTLVVLVSPLVGDLLYGVYLGRLGLRATDVVVTEASRWWSGAFFGVLALAGTAVALAGWGLLHRVRGPRAAAARVPTPTWAVLGLVYGAAVLALSSAVASKQAMADSGELPGRWAGITPSWVCWSPAGTHPVSFTGRALPPTGHTVVWIGSAEGRHALWSPESGGVTVSDPVRLRSREIPGGC